MIGIGFWEAVKIAMGAWFGLAIAPFVIVMAIVALVCAVAAFNAFVVQPIGGWLRRFRKGNPRGARP